jgi:polyisoprenoid-binding protein YceI
MNRFLLALLVAPTLAAAAAPETYTIDANHTHPGFAISHFGFSTFRGRFDKTTGTITLDREHKTGSADVTIDVNSISTGVPKLDEHLKSADFFDAAKYPTITYKAKELKFDGDKLVSATGDLTMHGVTKPVTLQVKNFKCGQHPLKNVPACGADLTGALKRSEFGVSKYSPNVGEDVALEIQVEAQAAAP